MTILFAVLFLLAAGIAGFFAFQNTQLKQQSRNKKYSEEDLQKKLSENKDLENQKVEAQIAEAKKRFQSENELELSKLKLKLQEEIQKEEKEMRQRILDLQENIDKKETLLDQKLEKLEQEKEKLDKVKDELREIKASLLAKREEVDQKEQEIDFKLNEELEKIAKLKSKEAKERILVESREKMGQELIMWQHKILENAEDEANKKAREIVAMAIQRCSSEVANEFTITTVKLKEEDKGKIIGKQGRNIQWLEKTLGVEFIIDETPEAVTISGFSSVRRNIAKRTLQKLLADGRIHPSSIEEMYEKSKAEIAEEVAQAGEWAVNELGIYDFPAKLTRIIGRLKFRTSYGQNMLKHSVEMAKLAGLLTDELNAAFPGKTSQVDKMICIKGALLHDVGKAVDEETIPKGNHIEIGEKICDMFGLDWKIKKCVSSHHNEEYEDPEKGFCIEAVLVDACDNISGSRPGARKETAEAYFQRMEALEKIAESTPGVTKSWIMRGSKEMWVFFDPEEISLAKMNQTTRKIAEEIGKSVNSPVKIKVVGFYDKRIIEFAG